ncbi:hypothetical protein MSTE_01824 [Mycobacteroides stephanolepidis]|uniref:Uncharacterized protein n=1 Tax=[Mycobacterium] stephanolepidis TaxID=1520670 RepID=A0A1Z4EW15_9MYCO|nr:hypothetical protein MSTE_01824 [[Mycobacterium] stephanolepidis]
MTARLNLATDTLPSGTSRGRDRLSDIEILRYFLAFFVRVILLPLRVVGRVLRRLLLLALLRLLRLVSLLRCLIVRVRFAGPLGVRSCRLVIRYLSSVLRLLTRVALLRALLPSLLGRPLSTGVVDRDAIVRVCCTDR